RALLQILINLTGNAVKFTQAGGVTLAVRDVDDGVRIEVRDTGPGLSASDRARLFEPFTQVGDARTRNAEGTGLGLHLSTKLAALMGGRIDVSSEFGQGSCFTLNLARG
ncbi:MAG TPA: ATP-binding protein, partial [Piscinibacter sp.]|nr:ATP-binding protein [Piscinibacter sp.]